MIQWLYRRAGLGNRLGPGERRHRLVEEIDGQTQIRASPGLPAPSRYSPCWRDRRAWCYRPDPIVGRMLSPGIGKHCATSRDLSIKRDVMQR
jgi:hypothetical protein